MTDKKELIKELIRNNPNVSGNELYRQIKGTELGIRKQTFQEIFRETKNLVEPTIQKREASIPKKFKTPKVKAKVQIKAKERIRERVIEIKKEIEAKEKIKKEKKAVAIERDITLKAEKKRIIFEKSKFGKMTKRTQTVFNLKERKAILIVRKILKIPKDDFRKLNRKERDILTEFGY